MKRVLFMIALVFLVSACAVDPRKEAEAYQIRSKADQERLNSEAARQQQQKLDEIQVQQEKISVQNREATIAEWRKGLNMVLHYGFYVATSVVCFILFMAARSIATSFATATEGLSMAIVRAAEVKANLIQLDPVTRQYPVYLQYLGNGRFSAVNLNVNAVLVLDTRNDPDRQMIAAMGATQYAGALAREARQSNDPAGMSMIQAPVIDAKSELLSIGKDLVSHE